MSKCKYCDKEFSNKKGKLDHELDEHEDEMSDHDRDDNKSELNKLKDKENNKRHQKRKTLQFAGIGVLLIGLVASGGYYAVQNLDSGQIQQANASIGVGEPVHWHADYEITVCGENQILQGGPTKAHTHGETTLHLEGVRRSRDQATLDWIVDQLGGDLEEDSIMGQESCNGEAGNLTVTVNGNQVENHLDYIPRDGDLIRIEYS